MEVGGDIYSFILKTEYSEQINICDGGKEKKKKSRFRFGRAPGSGWKRSLANYKRTQFNIATFIDIANKLQNEMPLKVDTRNIV